MLMDRKSFLRKPSYRNLREQKRENYRVREVLLVTQRKKTVTKIE